MDALSAALASDPRRRLPQLREALSFRTPSHLHAVQLLQAKVVRHQDDLSPKERLGHGIGKVLYFLPVGQSSLKGQCRRDTQHTKAEVVKHSQDADGISGKEKTESTTLQA